MQRTLDPDGEADSTSKSKLEINSQIRQVRKWARSLDKKVEDNADGLANPVEAIAPLFGLPIALP